MISKNKIFALCAVGLLGAALSGCSNAAPADLTIWCPSTDGDVMEEIVKNFKAAYPEYAEKTFSVVASHAEGDVQAEVKKDKTIAGDVFCIVDDNIRSAVDAETLLAIDDSEKAGIVASDTQDAVDSCSIDGKLYGYPYRADNAPLLIYNKKIVSDVAAATLDGILAACAEKNAKLYWDIANGWYVPSPFWGNGVTQKLTKDTDGVLKIDTTLYSDAGVAAAEALMATYINNKSAFEISSAANTIEAAFESETAGAAIFWNDTANIQPKIVSKGGTIGIAHLPSITINNQQVKMKSFLGYKAIAINNYVKTRGEETEKLAKLFAKFAANKDSQELRVKLGYGPSNVTVSNTADAKALPWVKAIADQMDPNVGGGTVPQASNVTSNFWDPMATVGTAIKNATKLGDWGSYGTAKKILKNIVNSSGWISHEYNK